MKKFIIASVCTLGLTLLGAFGNYQNSFAYSNELSTGKCTTNVEQIINSQNLKGLPCDNNSLAAITAAMKGDTSNKVKAAKVSANKAKNCVTKSESKKSNKSTGVKGASYDSQAKPNMVYKNINLSGCDSTKEVVQVLQKNGCKDITTSNVNNIKSLKDILNYINKDQKTQDTTTAPAQTTKPTTTPTPAQTTKPAPTTAPAQTTNTTQTAQPSSDVDSYATQVLQLINKERANAGLTALTTNSTLTAAANKRAQEIKQSFSHTRPDGSSFSSVLKEYGISYRSCGENIAYGQKTPAEVMNAWMNSSGHRANILNSNYNKVGIGVYKVNGVIYWTQEFTN